MKKLTPFLVGLFLLTPTAFAFADTVSVNAPTAYTGPDGNTDVGSTPLRLTSCSFTSDIEVYIATNDISGFNQDLVGETDTTSSCDNLQSTWINSFTSQISNNEPGDPQPWDYGWQRSGDYKLVVCATSDSTCAVSVGMGSQTGDGNGTIYASPVFTISDSLPPPPPTPTNGISSLISDGETAYQTTTGTSLSASVGWAGDNLIKPWVGSGLALLAGLAGWLAALAVIAAIVFFTFRALNNAIFLKGMNKNIGKNNGYFIGNREVSQHQYWKERIQYEQSSKKKKAEITRRNNKA